MRFFRLKESYLLFLIVIGLVSLAMYSTFALFTANTEIENVVNFDTSLNLGVRMFEYEMITLQPGETQIIEVNVTNDYTSSLYYGAWYEVITPSDTSNIDIGLYTDKNSTPGSGQMASNTSLSLIVGITNNATEDAIINIGVAGSVDNSLNLKQGRELIPSGWSDAIIVTDEYIEENKLLTTAQVNKTYEYTGEPIEDTLLPGTYKLEVWGAQGGSFDTTYVGGKGGYSYGTLTLMEETPIFVYVGGKGTDGTTSGTFAGGFNGGGQAYTSSATYAMSAGGGASDIRIGEDSLYARVIVAGGGGGAGTYSSSYRYSGGAGGGISGIAGGQYSTSYKAGLGGSSVSAGTSYYGTTANSTTASCTVANFGNGGAGGTSTFVAGGGGGWYGGGYARRASGGGGSGYVYTSSTASKYPSGCLLNSSYYLIDAATIGGNTSFTDFSGSTVTGHSGNGAVKITGESVLYSIPRLLGLTDLYVIEGSSVSLTDNITLKCETGESGCSLVGPKIIDTSSLEIGTHTIYYEVIGSDGKKYKIPRKVIVSKSLTISNILVNNSINQGIPTVGSFSLSSNNCDNLSYDILTKRVKISNFTQYQNCDLNFTTDNNYPLLNTMKVGEYVAYVGNNGCLNGATGTTGSGGAESGNSCLGQNANQPTDGGADSYGQYGYCFGGAGGFRYTTYGWRIAYIENGKVHLISAGAPKCSSISTSTNNATGIQYLNTLALNYCNAKYVDGGICPTTASENTAVRALGNTDFEKIIYAISGETSHITSAYGSPSCLKQYSYKRCGYGNDLIDNRGYYWFAAHNNNDDKIQWSPLTSSITNVSSSTTSTSYTFGIRPIIRLSSSVYVTGGTGTMEDPYTIGN